MKHIDIRELSLKFKTNLYIAKIKEEISNRKTLKGYSINDIFARRTTENGSLFTRFTNFGQS